MDKNFNLFKEFSSHINYALDNFRKKFKPELIDLETGNKIFLTDYQRFTCAVFLLETLKSLLMFWETGFGKTIACVYLIKNLFLIYPEWKVFLFVKSSLTNDPWKQTIDKYLPDHIKNNIYFINYDLINSDQLFVHRLNSIQITYRILYIFDESHDFIKKIIPKENEPVRRVGKILPLIIKSINRAYNKVLFMTATPINDSFYEFNYSMHILRNGNLNPLENLFTVDTQLIESNMLTNACLGLTSYQKRSSEEIFKNIKGTTNLAGKNINIVNISMSFPQANMYKIISKIELSSKSRGFRTLRKLVNTFAFLDVKIKAGLTNEKYLKLIKDKYNLFKKHMDTITFSSDFLNSFKNNTIVVNNETIMSKNLNFTTNSKNLNFTTNSKKLNFTTNSKKLNFTTNSKNLNPSLEEDIKKLEILHSYSSKYIKTCQIILNSTGKCLVYQPFVTFEGVKTLLEYFNKFNITYIEYTQKTKKNRTELIKKFNEKNNIYGEKIKVCVFSSAGTEGISFLCIKDLIIMDIPWSGSALEQIFGRAIRLNSHINLPLNEHFVNIYILINESPIDGSSVDREILDIIYNKESQKKQLVNILKISSIENIYDMYPTAEPVEIENLYPLVSNKYDLVEFKKKYISIIRNFTEIKYSYDESFTKLYNGYADFSTKEVYNDSILVGYLTNIYKIIDLNLVYLIKPL
jgi:predicted amino acid-binding ACT domain protein